MKKVLIYASLAIFTMSSLTSCNKKVKDKLDELESEVAALKTENTNIGNSITSNKAELDAKKATLDEYNKNLASPYPLNVTTEFFDYNGKPQVINSSYYFGKLSDFNSVMTMTDDGSYAIWLNRSENPDEESYAEFFIRIAADGKTILPVEQNSWGDIYHYWYGQIGNYDYDDYEVTYEAFEIDDVEYRPEMTYNVAALDYETGYISFTVTYEWTQEMSRLADDYSDTPNETSYTKTTFQYEGYLNVFDIDHIFTVM